jgi:hypothetical protein
MIKKTQGKFNITKFINVVHNIHKLKAKLYLIFLIDFIYRNCKLVDVSYKAEWQVPITPLPMHQLNSYPWSIPSERMPERREKLLHVDSGEKNHIKVGRKRGDTCTQAPP